MLIKGCFNWRMKFPLKAESFLLPENYRMDIQVWDKDLLTSNDFLASITLDGWPVIRMCLRDGRKATAKNEEGDTKLETFAHCNPNSQHKDKQVKIVYSLECLFASE